MPTDELMRRLDSMGEAVGAQRPGLPPALLAAVEARGSAARVRFPWGAAVAAALVVCAGVWSLTSRWTPPGAARQAAAVPADSVLAIVSRLNRGGIGSIDQALGGAGESRGASEGRELRAGDVRLGELPE